MDYPKRNFFLNTSNLLLILIIIITIVLLGGIYFLLTNANKKSLTSQTTTPTGNAIVTISPDGKKYTSSLNYTVDYPDNLVPVEDREKQTVSFQVATQNTKIPVFTIAITKTPFSNSPTGDMEAQGKKLVTEWKEVTISGQKGHQYIRNLCPKDCETLNVDLPYKGGTQILSITLLSSDKEQFEKILTSFTYKN